MRKTAALTTTILLVMILAGCTSSGKKEYRVYDFYQEYRNSEGFISLSISPSLLTIFTGKNNTELREFLRSLDDIRILIYDRSPDSINYYADMLRSRLSPTLYREIMMVENGDEKTEIRVIDKNEKIAELVLISSGIERMVVISITGNYELEKVRNIAPYLDIDAAGHLEKIITPNPR